MRIVGPSIVNQAVPSPPPAGSSGRPLRVGVLGCGYIADIHMQSLLRTGPIELVAADADPAAAERLVAAHGGRQVEPTRLAASDLDVAYVCTPHDVRLGPVEALASTTPLVVCEKPLALTFGQAQCLVDRLGDDGERVVVAFNLRFMPGVLALADWLGPRRTQVRRVRVDVTSPPFLDSWAGTRERGGGVLVCLGSHAIDLWRHLLGREAVEVRAVASHVRLGPELEPDTATVVLRDADGILATVTVQDAGSDRWSIEARQMLDIDIRTTAAAARASAVALTTWEDEPTVRAVHLDGGSGDFLEDWGYAGMARAVRRRLSGLPQDAPTPELASLADGLAVARLVDRAREAAHHSCTAP